MSETISDTQLRLEQFISEQSPNADLSPGSAFSELVVKNAAVLQNPIVNDLSTLSQGDNITKALASEVDTFNTVIDNVAANYDLTRGDGKKSSGKIKVKLTSSNNIYLKSGVVFTQPVLALNYITTAAYVISRTPSTGDIPIIAEGAQFYFILPLEAENAGAEYQLNDQMVLTPVDFTIPNFIEAAAYGNFTTGLAEETDKELISRLHTGLANKTLLTDSSIRSYLRDTYPEFQTLSIIGPNASEMTRSKQNVFGLSTLGVADVYVRTSKGLETQQLEKIATEDAANGRWYVDLSYDDAPGFYKVLSVLPVGLTSYGTLEYTQEISYSLAEFEVANKIVNSSEARFSRYQTCRIYFTITDTTAFTGAVSIVVSLQPFVGEIQNTMNQTDQHIVCADYLVKAVVPCFVSVALNLKKKKASTVLPIDKIKQDIFNYINSRDFGESVEISELINICHNYEIKSVTLPVKLTGQIYTPKSTVINISSESALEIPDLPLSGVTKRTTLFIADYATSSEENKLTESITITTD